MSAAIVIAGKDKGKTGKVLAINPKSQRAVVESINTSKKARRRTQQDQQGGFMDLEVPIHLSNLALIDKKKNKPTRYGISVGKDGSKLRLGKKSGDTI